ncbi:MAG: hypothetical protein DWI25_09055 [Planctomycetota bacterium]|nr:MAG: hypothetical protein DWI25_09055 [Planctomycetota bacterium]
MLIRHHSWCARCGTTTHPTPVGRAKRCTGREICEGWKALG